MNIILVSSRLKTAKTLHVTPRFLLWAALGLIFLSFVSSFAFSWVGIRFNLPFASDLVAMVQQQHNKKNEEYLRENVSAMAIKLGEMQAQVVRLDSLGERISKLSGVSLPKTEVGNKGGKETAGGKGGPLIRPSAPLSAMDLQREIDRLGEIIEQRSDELTALESQLMERRIKSTLLPTITPIEASYLGSPFGRRIDPIAGVGAMHEGIDFVADIGTPVIASAGGVVLTAESHPQYGLLVNRPRQRVHLTLCPFVEDFGQGRADCPARATDRSERQYRPFDRPASAFRSALQGRGPESFALPANG